MLLRLIACVSWFYMHWVLPLSRRRGDKPRLQPLAPQFDLLLQSDRFCKLVLRFTAEEIHALAHDLLIDAASLPTSNWRFTPLHRLCIFLLAFTNHWPSRKLRHATGWAANSVLNNWRWHLRQVVEVLDAPGSGKRAAHQPA